MDAKRAEQAGNPARASAKLAGFSPLPSPATSRWRLEAAEPATRGQVKATKVSSGERGAGCGQGSPPSPCPPGLSGRAPRPVPPRRRCPGVTLRGHRSSRPGAPPRSASRWAAPGPQAGPGPPPPRLPLTFPGRGAAPEGAEPAAAAGESARWGSGAER